VIRTSFWFTMGMSTVGLLLGVVFAAPISHWIGLGHDPALVRAGAVGLWAQTNFQQLTALFRVEERSTQYAIASVANVLITVVAMVLFVAVFHWGAIGLVVGNFTGTLVVYAVLLGYRRFQLGLEFDRPLFRQMQRFGLPFVPSGLALWAIDFADRFFLLKLKNAAAVGLYSVGVRVSTAILLLLIAIRTAWPAFAYSIKDDSEAKRTYGFVLTYVLYVACWVSLALSLLAPWIVRALTTPAYYAGARVVPLLVFGGTAFIAYNVMTIGTGRAKQTQFNWLVTGLGAVVNVALNFALIPPFGMMGAAAATVAAYVVMFLGITVRSQQVFRVPYQWRRIALVVAAAVGLTVLGKSLHVPLAGAVALSAVYPLILLPLGFYLPVELRRLRALVLSAR
jgi:O-antigen/teichoic acid export membrane protein